MKGIAIVLLVFSLLQLPYAGCLGVADAASEEGEPLTSAVVGDVVVITLGDPITVQGDGAVVSGSVVTITASGLYRAIGTLADAMIAVDTDGEVELTLDGVAITHSEGPAITVANAGKLSLVLADGTTNTLVDGETYSESGVKGTLFSNDPLEISGDGALDVTGNYKHGIMSDDDIIIAGGTITISAATDGIHANDNITVTGGTIDVAQANDGIESEGTLFIQGGALNLAVDDDGIIGAETFTIDGGTIHVTTAVDGIESKDAVVINGGELTVVASESGIKGANDITIRAGQVYVDSAGDALRSGGSLTIDGGVIVALGAASGASGIDCDPCIVSGGILLATGGTNSAPVEPSTQKSVVLGSAAVGDTIDIASERGDALTLQVSKSYQNLLFSSPSLVAGGAYTVYAGGSASGGTDFHGLYSGADYSGGSAWGTFVISDIVTYVGDTLAWHFYYPLSPYSAE